MPDAPATFELKSTQSATLLRFEWVGVEQMVATVETVGLSASTDVYTFMSGVPIDLFEAIAREWRGWQGPKQWESLEGELKLTATMDRTGHVSVQVELRRGGAWELRAWIVLEAGQLDAIAAQLRRFGSAGRAA